ncbi:hypothetical protein ACJX0J_034157, partial [Zea mays]
VTLKNLMKWIEGEIEAFDESDTGCGTGLLAASIDLRLTNHSAFENEPYLPILKYLCVVVEILFGTISGRRYTWANNLPGEYLVKGWAKHTSGAEVSSLLPHELDLKHFLQNKVKETQIQDTSIWLLFLQIGCQVGVVVGVILKIDFEKAYDKDKFGHDWGWGKIFKQEKNGQLMAGYLSNN